MKWEETVARGDSVILGRLEKLLCGVRQYLFLPLSQHSLCPLRHDKPFPAELHLPEKTQITPSKLLQLFLQLCRLSARPL